MDRGLTYTGNTGQQIALVPKARVALDVVANPRFQLSNRALQPFDMTFDLVRHRLMGLLKASCDLYAGLGGHKHERMRACCARV